VILPARATLFMMKRVAMVSAGVLVVAGLTTVVALTLTAPEDGTPTGRVAGEPNGRGCSEGNLALCSPSAVRVIIQGFQIEITEDGASGNGDEVTTYIGSVNAPKTEVVVHYGQPPPPAKKKSTGVVDIGAWSPYSKSPYESSSSPYFTSNVRYHKGGKTGALVAATMGFAKVPRYTVECHGDSLTDGLTVGMEWGGSPTEGLDIYRIGCGKSLESMDVELEYVGDGTVQITFLRDSETLVADNPEVATPYHCRGKMTESGRLFRCDPKG
jgi:hypothetical protein